MRGGETLILRISGAFVNLVHVLSVTHYRNLSLGLKNDASSNC